MDDTLIRVVLPNGKRRDFDISRVFTNGDQRRLVSDVIMFINLNTGADVMCYPVKEGEITDGMPNEKPWKV